MVLAIPLLSLRLGQLDAGTDPTSQSSRRAYDLLAQGFGPGVNGPLTVVVQLPDGSRPDQHARCTSASRLAGTPGVASVSPPTVNPSGTDRRAQRRADDHAGGRRRPATWSTSCATTCCPR